MAFDVFVSELIAKAVKGSTNNRLSDFVALAEQANGVSDGKKWTREELYERR